MRINPKKAMLIGLASSMLFTAAGCKKSNNETTEEKTTITTEDNELEDVYGPPVEDTTEINETPTVYGPPLTEQDNQSINQTQPDLNNSFQINGTGDGNDIDLNNVDMDVELN